MAITYFANKFEFILADYKFVLLSKKTRKAKDQKAKTQGGRKNKRTIVKF